MITDGPSWIEMASGEHLTAAQNLLAEAERTIPNDDAPPTFPERLALAHLAAAQVQATADLTENVRRAAREAEQRWLRSS